MALTIRSLITEEGFAIEVCGPTETAYSLAFFATGCGGYHASGEVKGQLPASGRYVHFETTPFPILAVGISDLAIGAELSIRELLTNFEDELPPVGWSSPFQGRKVPDKQPVKLK